MGGDEIPMQQPESNMGYQRDGPEPMIRGLRFFGVRGKKDS